jgi:HK97 gp10 family phage protein
LITGLDNLKPQYQQQAQRAIKAAAKECYKDSQDNCPVGTNYTASLRISGTHAYYAHIPGSLKGSGKITYPDDLSAEVSYGGESTTGETVDYQWYVEMGTHKMAAQPFLMPAFEHASRLLAIDVAGINALNKI